MPPPLPPLLLLLLLITFIVEVEEVVLPFVLFAGIWCVVLIDAWSFNNGVISSSFLLASANDKLILVLLVDCVPLQLFVKHPDGGLQLASSGVSIIFLKPEYLPVIEMTKVL